MRLSVNAREFVAEEVKDAFADEYKAAKAISEEHDRKAKGKWESFKKDYGDLSECFLKDLGRILKRHGLTFKNGHSLKKVYVSCSDSVYDWMNSGTFNETSSGCCNELEDVKSKIRRSIDKALFEIEVHGRKDTFEQIISDVIKSVKNSK